MEHGRQEIECPLCGKTATGVPLLDKDAYRVECTSCETYEVSEDVMQNLGEMRRNARLVASASRREAAKGGRLLINGRPHFVKIAADEPR